MSMLYHHQKHADFNKSPVSMDDYFGKLSESIFNSKNQTSKGYSQGGSTMKRTYTSSFELNKHVGFIVEDDEGEKIASHYTIGNFNE